MLVLVLNGPNLGRLGQRQPEIYGRVTLAEILATLRARAAEDGHEIQDLQTNHEGVLIDRIERRDYDAILINPGAWTHYSYAIRDALAASDVPVAEVHISDVSAREEFRSINVLEGVASHSVIGKGWRGYLEALDWIIENAGPRRIA